MVTVNQGHFSNVGLALGSVRGARSWVVRIGEQPEKGLLSGLYYPQTWYPGENLAMCRKQPPSQGMHPNAVPQRAKGPQEITTGHLGECLCGFYAFYDGSNDFYDAESTHWTSDIIVAGMVEGYGETLIGTRGFRCTKARIVALMIRPEQSIYDTVLEHYPGVPVFHDFSAMIREFPTDDGGANEQRKTQ